MTDPYACTHCGTRFVVASLAATPNCEHQTGCPLRTNQEDRP